MKSLLKSDFRRLINNKLFWLSIVASIASGINAIFTMRGDPEYICIDDGFDFLVFVPLMIICILIPFLICNDFSSGMIRNKISCGHKRSNIYLSGLITSLTAVLICFAISFIVYFPMAIMEYGAEFRVEQHQPYERYVVIAAMFLMIMAFTVLSHFLSALITKKSVVITALIISLLGYLVFFEAQVIVTVYSSPTIYSLVEEEDEDGRHVEVYAEEENPMYRPDGSPEKTIGKILNVAVVCAQDVPITLFDMNTIVKIMIYDTVVIFGLSTLGAYIFKRKDIK